MIQKLIIIILLFLQMFAMSSIAMSQWAQTQGPASGTIGFAAIGANLYAGSGSMGTGPEVLRSTDSGSNWSVFSKPFTDGTLGIFNSFIFKDSYMLGSGFGVFRSTDSGLTWISSGLSGLRIYAFAISGNYIFTGTSSDYGGNIYFSTDDGINWFTSSRGFNNSSVSCFFTNGTDIFLGSKSSSTTSGGIFLSTNNGTRWTMINPGFAGSNFNVYTLTMIDNNLFAATDIGVIRSTDYGTNWTTVNKGLLNLPINSLAVSGKNLFAMSSDGIFLTTNYGDNWLEVDNGLPSSGGYSLYVSDNYLFTSLYTYGIWRRPLSEMINTNAVSVSRKNERSITSFPNPFSQSTSIKFSLSDHSFAQVSIHNLLGSEVARLFTGTLDAGEHVFSWDAHDMPQGTYVAMVKIGGEVREIPMMLVK